MPVYADDYPTRESILAGTATRGYRPTVDDYVPNERHKWLAGLPLKGVVLLHPTVPGKLRSGDALKLHEMASVVNGDILELGTYRGLSSTIMGEALRDTGKPFKIYTADLDPEHVAAARAAHAKHKLNNIITHVSEGGEFARACVARGMRFDFAFIDHWHGYEATVEVCDQLSKLINNGGFVLFHDFIHVGNVMPEEAGYGVVDAIEDALPKSFKFQGIFGCSALFRHQP